MASLIRKKEQEIKRNGSKEKNTEPFSVIEQCPDEADVVLGLGDCLTNILSDFDDYLTQAARRSLGYPANQECNRYVDLFRFLRFHINNIGDPFKESNFGLHSKKFELAVLEWFAQLWEIETHKYWGYVTNGGTEGNLHALLLGRELLPDGILYTSLDSHYSVFKAARMYRMDCKKIATLASGEMDCTDLTTKLLLNKDRPAIINVTIGTTFKGGIDDLDLVIETLEQCGFPQSRFYIHCDAAFSGLIIPFLELAPKYTFKKPIGSISVSGHKLLAAPMPCGVVMTRQANMNLLRTDIEYISTLDTTISGSRNGHASIFMWYGLSTKGHMGLRQDVEKCVRNAEYLRDRLKGLGISCMLNEMSVIVVFERPPDYEFVRHWQLSCVGKMAHVVVTSHITKQMLEDFLDDLVQKRKLWHQFGEMQPPCLADDIGDYNCACPVHGHKV